jgi:hypothetical protein
VHGIDLSAAMVAKLREKPGGDRIPVTIGDIAITRVEGRFALVYLVFNSIPNLTSQAEQVACVLVEARCVAAELAFAHRFKLLLGPIKLYPVVAELLKRRKELIARRHRGTSPFVARVALS